MSYLIDLHSSTDRQSRTVNPAMRPLACSGGRRHACGKACMLAAKQGGTCGEVGAHGGQCDGNGRSSGAAHA